MHIPALRHHAGLSRLLLGSTLVGTAVSATPVVSLVGSYDRVAQGQGGKIEIFDFFYASCMRPYIYLFIKHFVYC